MLKPVVGSIISDTIKSIIFRAETGAISPPTGYTVSSTSGTAPMMVHFSADFSGDATGFHYYDYTWDFDDPTSGTWGTTGKSRNAAKGPVTGHVFETAGTYAVTLTVRGFFGNVVASQTFNITVADPDVTFAGTDTVCVNPAGDTDFTGAPSGCVQLSTDDMSVVTPYAVAGTRILFKRGASWAVNTNVVWPVNSGPVHIGAYGSGTQDASGRYTNAPEFTVSGASFIGLGNRQNWVWMDLNFTGTVTNNLIYNPGTHSDILIYRLKSENFYIGIGWGSGAPRSDGPNQRMAIVDCKVDTPDLNGMFIGGEYLFVAGNESRNVTREHAIRIWQAYKSVISNNKASGAALTYGGGRHALKLHSVRDEIIDDPANQYEMKRTNFTVVSDNVFGSSPPSPIAITPQNPEAAEQISNMIIERNRYIADFGQYPSPSSFEVQTGILFSGKDSTIRNNVIDGTNQGFQLTGVFVGKYQNVESSNVRVYNNTVYKNDSISEGAIGSNWRRAVRINSGVINAKVFNNVVITAEYVGQDPVGLIDYSTSTESGTNTFTYDTSILVDPENVDPFARDYNLKPTATMLIDQGTQIDYVYEDFYGRTRSDGLPFDIGAAEFIATYSLFKPSGSDSLITFDSLTFKVRD